MGVKTECRCHLTCGLGCRGTRCHDRCDQRRQRCHDSRSLRRLQHARKAQIGRDVSAAGHDERASSTAQRKAAVGRCRRRHLHLARVRIEVEYAIVIGVGEDGGAGDIALHDKAVHGVRPGRYGYGDILGDRSRVGAVARRRRHVQVDRSDLGKSVYGDQGDRTKICEFDQPGRAIIRYRRVGDREACRNVADGNDQCTAGVDETGGNRQGYAGIHRTGSGGPNGQGRSVLRAVNGEVYRLGCSVLRRYRERIGLGVVGAESLGGTVGDRISIRTVGCQGQRTQIARAACDAGQERGLTLIGIGDRDGPDCVQVARSVGGNVLGHTGNRWRADHCGIIGAVDREGHNAGRAIQGLDRERIDLGVAGAEILGGAVGDRVGVGAVGSQRQRAEIGGARYHRGQ